LNKKFAGLRQLIKKFDQAGDLVDWFTGLLVDWLIG
jgi:hypothetical protein